MQKKTAVALAVVVSILAGCSFGPNRGTTGGAANEPLPMAVVSCPRWLSVVGTGPISSDISANGYDVKGGTEFNKKTGDYYVEKGCSINFSNGHKITGPASGNYYEDLKKVTDSK